MGGWGISGVVLVVGELGGGGGLRHPLVRLSSGQSGRELLKWRCLGKKEFWSSAGGGGRRQQLRVSPST